VDPTVRRPTTTAARRRPALPAAPPRPATSARTGGRGFRNGSRPGHGRPDGHVPRGRPIARHGRGHRRGGGRDAGPYTPMDLDTTARIGRLLRFAGMLAVAPVVGLATAGFPWTTPGAGGSMPAGPSTSRVIRQARWRTPMIRSVRSGTSCARWQGDLSWTRTPRRAGSSTARGSSGWSTSTRTTSVARRGFRRSNTIPNSAR